MILLPAFGVLLAIGVMLLLLKRNRFRTTPPRKLFLGFVAISFLGSAPFLAKPLISLVSGTSGWTWDKVVWRAKLFARKAEGDVPDLSWRELWFMTHVRGGFSLENFVELGSSLDGSLMNPFCTNTDYEVGKQTFRARCAVCHGNEATGGLAPALNHSLLRHGDSDLAMYKVVRDGIPKTGMAPVPISTQERWQVIGYLRSLQFAASNRYSESLRPMDIHVSSDEIQAAGNAKDQWLTYSGTLDGRRYTPLDEITPKNVSQLRLRWIRQFGTSTGKIESTPIVVGGFIFTTLPPSDVAALDVKTGEIRWLYKGSVPDNLPIDTTASNRGLAVLGNVLFLQRLDCILVAINAKNGDVIWQTKVCSTSDDYTMTGAPLIANGSVIVGVSGAEYGIRGFVAAYDAKTGQQQWKFNTAAGPGEFGYDTWKNDAWQSGGGSTWVTGSYDPTLDLLYWGVGNPAPAFNGDVRPGDNLFTDSVVALHASSGKLAWHFQFTPHDEHDWDATQTPILADLTIKGTLRRVLCAPDRNGFYYVLDRTTGQFLLGVPFVEQNWAQGLDPAGRPILTTHAELTSEGRLTKPGSEGGINWQNPAFDQKSGLIFVPATEGASVFTKSPKPRRGNLGFYPGSSGTAGEYDQVSVVRAFDAATGVKKWEHFPPPGGKELGYSGLLATGGRLVFGQSGGYAFAIDSATGKELWRVFLGGFTYAAPISFNVDGHQVILLSAGQDLFLFGL
ncbi:MAG TPA: PQQ-binding-like beta-propeller repeat protein [Candidatus Acidoferrum sp.]|nr:PQQ-binding-like beta-propeller repeat protein [Candidatus Acidoferrum sp.]